MDRRWQLVVGLHGPCPPAAPKGTLVAFRAGLTAHNLDRRLVERTLALHHHSAGRPAGGQLRGGVGWQPIMGYRARGRHQQPLRDIDGAWASSLASTGGAGGRRLRLAYSPIRVIRCLGMLPLMNA
jgi:hypothetical protein